MAEETIDLVDRYVDRVCEGNRLFGPSRAGEGGNYWPQHHQSARYQERRCDQQNNPKGRRSAQSPAAHLHA